MEWFHSAYEPFLHVTEPEWFPGIPEVPSWGSFDFDYMALTADARLRLVLFADTLFGVTTGLRHRAAAKQVTVGQLRALNSLRTGLHAAIFSGEQGRAAATIYPLPVYAGEQVGTPEAEAYSAKQVAWGLTSSKIHQRLAQRYMRRGETLADALPRYLTSQVIQDIQAELSAAARDTADQAKKAGGGASTSGCLLLAGLMFIPLLICFRSAGV